MGPQMEEAPRKSVGSVYLVDCTSRAEEFATCVACKSVQDPCVKSAWEPSKHGCFFYYIRSDDIGVQNQEVWGTVPAPVALPLTFAQTIYGLPF